MRAKQRHALNMDVDLSYCASPKKTAAQDRRFIDVEQKP